MKLHILLNDCVRSTIEKQFFAECGIRKVSVSPMRLDDSSLQGAVNHSADVALLLIDVINDLEFEDGEKLLEFAQPMAERVSVLKRQFHNADLPVIYANDNFGRWNLDLRIQVENCLQNNVRGKPIVEMLRPIDDDYFVLKPKHSAFYATTLDVLLKHLRIRRLVITGVATDICVLFTANDGYMRDFEILIPSDCVAANSREQSDAALTLMQRVLKADTRDSSALIQRLASSRAE